MSEFRNERDQYIKNKSRSNQGGDWWVTKTEGEQQPLSFSSSKKSQKGGSADHDIPSTRLATFSKGDIQGEPQVWLAHRRKKAIDRDYGKHFNILTGLESLSAPSGRYDPTKNAKRISVDKIENAQRELQGRYYNIISNEEN